MPALNYVGILVTAVVIFLIGGLWYTVLFGKAWVAAHGYTPEQQERMRKGAGRAYALSFLAYIVLAAVMDLLIIRMGIDSAIGGVKLGAALWLGFVATIGFTANVYSEKPLATYLIDVMYQLVFMIAAGVILAVWP